MLYAIVALLMLIVDQGMKYWTTTHVALDTGKHVLLPGLIDLRNIHNSGSAFSFLGGWSGARWLFLAVTVLFAVLVILALSKKVIRCGFGRWMALCVLAGALGNAIDRSLYGYVIDMFEFAFFPSFPVFNVADIYITVCGVLFCFYVLLNKDPLGAPAEAELRPGPGGSMTRSAPKRKEEKKPAEKKPAVTKTEPVAAKPAVAPAHSENTEEEKGDFLTRLRRNRSTEKSERDLQFEKLKRPVVTHESFLEVTRRKPGEDPFAEWSTPASPVGNSEPDEPTRILVSPEVKTAAIMPAVEEPTRVLPVVEEPKQEKPEVKCPVVEEPLPESPVIEEAQPETESTEEDFNFDIPESVVESFNLDQFLTDAPSEAEAQIYAVAEEALNSAEEKPLDAVAEEPKTAAVADEVDELVFSLEDILNEFRDL